MMELESLFEVDARVLQEDLAAFIDQLRDAEVIAISETEETVDT